MININCFPILSLIFLKVLINYCLFYVCDIGEHGMKTAAKQRAEGGDKCESGCRKFKQDTIEEKNLATTVTATLQM